MAGISRGHADNVRAPRGLERRWCHRRSNSHRQRNRPCPRRVVLDNGRYAVSDQNGWFSFAGVRPGPRLLRLDPASLCGVADMERVAKVRVVVPTAGIAMVDLSLTPPTINAVTQSIVLEEGSI